MRISCGCDPKLGKCSTQSGTDESPATCSSEEKDKMPGKIVLANRVIRLGTTPVVGMLVRLCTSSSFTRSVLDDAFKVKRKKGEFRVVVFFLLPPHGRKEPKTVLLTSACKLYGKRTGRWKTFSTEFKVVVFFLLPPHGKKEPKMVLLTYHL